MMKTKIVLTQPMSGVGEAGKAVEVSPERAERWVATHKATWPPAVQPPEAESDPKSKTTKKAKK